MERIVFNSDGKSMQYEMLIGTSLNEFGIEISVADVGKTVGSLVEYIDSKKE